MKLWLQERIQWITNTLGSFSACSNVITPPLVISKIMYAPDSTALFTGERNQEFLEILNNGSSTVDLTGIYLSRPGFVYQFPADSYIEPGAQKSLLLISLFSCKVWNNAFWAVYTKSVQYRRNSSAFRSFRK